MIPWELCDRAPVPGQQGEMRLYRRGGEFSIRVDGQELMNSSLHGSEDTLAELACARISGRPAPRLLIGGLGMGYTLASALRHLGAVAEVVVAELVPAVVQWNLGPLGDLAGHPLADPRSHVVETDVARLLKTERRAFDAIVLDVDNGPRGLTRKSNDWLYTRGGLDAAFAALRPGGVLLVWSASPDETFTRRLGQAGFGVEEVHARARGSKGGARHIIWIASRPG